MVSIKVIKLKDLEQFVNSDTYISFTNKPISILRVQSYLKNPNANADDYVLYMAFIKTQLVGYRTILSDHFITNNKAEQFGWLSGNWVHPNYRRFKISTHLFNAVSADWNNRLLFTNYAKASKAVYDKTAAFTILKTLKGTRYYQRICLADLLPQKADFFQKITPFLKIIDTLSNLLLDVRFKFSRTKNDDLHTVEKLDWNDDINYSFLSSFKKNELFQRTENAYKWIENNPWIKTNLETKLQSKNYYFSSYAKNFDSQWYKITNNKTAKIVAIIHISIRDKQLKIPYLYYVPEALNTVRNFVLNHCKKQSINYATIYDIQLNEILKNIKNLFLTHKEFEQNYYVTKSLLKDFPKIKNKEIQTGDGDGVFT